jgi:prepilin-type N-terminal cleavage/methylation domain-containing protein
MRQRTRVARYNRPGFALLEVLIAMLLLSIAGATAAAAAIDAIHAVRLAHHTEEVSQRASAFLDAVALWPREDLDRRLGDHPQGPWRLRIDRLSPSLYAITLADSGARALVRLRTSVYRPLAIQLPRDEPGEQPPGTVPPIPGGTSGR